MKSKGSMGQNIRKSKKFRLGGYAALLTAGVLILTVLVNMALSTLENRFNWRIDVTGNQMYSITNASSKMVRELDQDIELIVLLKTENSSPYLEELTRNYAKESERLTVSIIDPVRDPALLEEFKQDGNALTDGTVIVTNAEHTKFRVLAWSDLIIYDYETYQVQGYNGEQMITAAINYVTSDNSPKVYLMTGHNEATYDQVADFADTLTKDNYDVRVLSLLAGGSLEKGDTVVVIAPEKDLTDSERETMRDFLENGGRMLYLANAVTPSLPNFESLLKLFNVSMPDGKIYEDATQIARWYKDKSAIVPAQAQHAILTSIQTAGYQLCLPNARPVEAQLSANSTISAAPLLTTSNGSYLRKDKTNASDSKIEGDVSGPFAIALAAENVISDTESNNARIVVVGSSLFLTDAATRTISGNAQLAVGAVKWLSPQSYTVTISPKYLLGGTLNIASASTALTLIVVTVVIMPAILLAAGLVVWLRRRHL